MRFYKAALAAGGADNGAPGIRAHYHPNYYGAFVLDPDGHNIEAVCHLPAQHTRPHPEERNGVAASRDEADKHEACVDGLLRSVSSTRGRRRIGAKTERFRHDAEHLGIVELTVHALAAGAHGGENHVLA